MEAKLLFSFVSWSSIRKEISLAQYFILFHAQGFWKAYFQVQHGICLSWCFLEISFVVNWTKMHNCLHGICLLPVFSWQMLKLRTCSKSALVLPTQRGDSIIESWPLWLLTQSFRERGQHAILILILWDSTFIACILLLAYWAPM